MAKYISLHKEIPQGKYQDKYRYAVIELKIGGKTFRFKYKATL